MRVLIRNNQFEVQDKEVGVSKYKQVSPSSIVIVMTDGTKFYISEEHNTDDCESFLLVTKHSEEDGAIKIQPNVSNSIKIM